MLSPRKILTNLEQPHPLVFELWEVSLSSRVIAKHVKEKSWPALETKALRAWIRLVVRLQEMLSCEKELSLRIRQLQELVPTVSLDRRELLLTSFLECLHAIGCKIDDQNFESISSLSATVGEGFRNIPEEAIRLFGDILDFRNSNHTWAVGCMERAAIKNIERKFRNEVARDRITGTLVYLLRKNPEFDLLLYFRRSRQFLDLLDSIGMLPDSMKESVSHLFSTHPAFDFDPVRVSLYDISTLAKLCGKNWPVDLFHDKLKAHLAGEHLLRSEVLAHYREDFVNRVIDLRIALAKIYAEQLAHDLISRNLDLHTVHLLCNLENENRRGMKRFVSALSSGNRNYRENHPSNRRWIARHAHLDLSLWLYDEEHRFHVSFGDGEEFFIDLETDPEIELKMGSLVGSCLSSGAFNSFSAVSNTLDVNKRVAFLRNVDGKFLARQLLAISTTEQLIAFDVYTARNRSESDSYEEAFRAFDYFLAEQIGVAVNTDDSYTIENLIAPYWYDDGSWEPGASPICTEKGAAKVSLVLKKDMSPALAS